MIKRILLVASVAIQTLRANPLHTLLSTLGLVIGVAALVAILSLGDGLEQYARNQISTTTSLEGIVIQPKTRTYDNGVSLAIKSIPQLSLENAEAIADTLGNEGELSIRQVFNALVTVPGDTIEAGAYLEAIQPTMFNMMRAELSAGNFFSIITDTTNRELVLSSKLASTLFPEDSVSVLIGRQLLVDGVDAKVVGVLDGTSEGDTPAAYGHFRNWSKAFGRDVPAGVLVRAGKVENVPALKSKIEHWLDVHIAQGSEAFNVITNQARVAQVQKGIRVFKIVMGLITGISVLVGGIGVMNVLLIAITERTKEIGIRKATGARRRDIVIQFLTESVAISMAGSMAGVVLGLTTLAIATPIIKSLAEVPFEMAFSANSLLVICTIALAVGVGFGTYPAWRAAILSPVDAIRHE